MTSLTTQVVSYYSTMLYTIPTKEFCPAARTTPSTGKGDDFGGQEIIARFEGWFDYIRQDGRRVDFSEAAP
ncbi:MAG TPA: hypothetical protein PKA66_09015 [Gemmatimonadales bacterium]|nr:hypothetical protein [Gemmatimonadales bacterium]